MKLNKKGFTLVELVIVIAVIAILAGVLIGTFATVIDNANQSKAMQEAKREFTEFLTEIDYTREADKAVSSYVIKSNNYYFAIKKGEFNTQAYKQADKAIEATGETVTDNTLKEYNGTALTAGTYFKNSENKPKIYAVVTV